MDIGMLLLYFLFFILLFYIGKTGTYYLISFFTKPKIDVDIFKGLEESLKQSFEMNHKLRTCYEPTYAEIKEFYQKYVDRVKQRREGEENSGIWSAEEIKHMTLEEYLDNFIEKEYYGNNLYHYCCEQCAFMWSFNPNTGRSQIWM